MKFIINRKIFISMLFLGLTILGYVSYNRLQVELAPNSELPTLSVMVNARSESDPNYIENQAVIPIEGAIGTMEGVEDITTTITNQRATISINFKNDVNTQLIQMRLEETLNEVAQTLDEDEFTVQVASANMNAQNNQFMTLQIRGSGGVDRIRNIMDQEITPQLENIEGIASVTVYGGQEKSVEVLVDAEACEAYNITSRQIASAISSNAQSRTFTGNVHDAEKKYFVHVSANYEKISDIENVIVADGPILLKDIAEVYFGVIEETSYSRLNGLDAISATLVNDSQSNLIDLSHRTTEIINEINQKYKSRDIELVVQSNSAEIMETNINEIMRLALIGGLLAIFILWMFLKNLRIVSFIALAIPISVFIAFNCFYMFDITINSFTLVGIALAIGMLLDNSVVVLENIYRLSGKGYSPDNAVIQGTKEVWRSIIAATLTTIAVFVPFLFTSDYDIKLLGENVGTAIISTLLISLFVALLFIPMSAHLLLRSKKAKNIFYEKVTTNNRIIQIYIVFLKASMRSPAITIIGALVIFFVTIITVLSMSTNSQTTIESDQIIVSVDMPTGSTLEATDVIARQVEERLETLAEKEDISTQVEQESATITVSLKEDYKKILDRGFAQIESDVEDLLGRRIGRGGISVGGSSSGGMSLAGGGMGMSSSFSSFIGIGSNEETIVIKGEDFEVMQGVAEDLEYYIEELESINRVNTNISSNQPEVHMNFDQLLLTEHDLTLNSISSSLNSFATEFSAGITFKQGNEEYDIIIKEEERNEDENEDDEKTMGDLKRMQIGDETVGYYFLEDVANIYYASGMSSITRENQEKRIVMTYQFVDEAQESTDLLEAYRLEIDNIVQSYDMPSGIAIEVIHEEDQYSEFYILIAAAFILIIMILASVFESLSTPFVLIFSIPLAAIGSFLGLIFTDNSILNGNTLIGFLILLGIVVNNGIILIDYTNILRDRGFRRSRALMTAGLSRVRPILITATTTIIAMFPLAMGQAEYVGVIGAPFAITVIGGLAVSTILTLVFIPTLYSGLENTLEWMKSLALPIKIIHSIIFIISSLYIYFEVETLMWQAIDFMLLILLIPGVTYFVMTSLRQAKTKLIKDDDRINIRISKLVKIYGRDSRFVREWKSGNKIRERAGITKKYDNIRDFYDLTWMVPLFGFAFYFTFFFLENPLWMFILSHIIYFMQFAIWKPFQTVLENRSQRKGKPGPKKLANFITKLLIWGSPAIYIYIFFTNWENTPMAILVAILWLLCLIVYFTSEYLYENNINVDRITGRLGTLRRGFFRLIKQIPIIGKRNIPFRALNGVSINIGTGMFGLLGPNGAGKSTMMRIICGIYEQSYGKIYVNGLDTQKYREELQGLIGYLPQEFGTYENMSCLEYLDYQAILKGLKDKKVRAERLEYVVKSVHLYEKRNDKIGSYSGGMKQRVGIAQILLNLPRILIVDEPTAGLDPRERIRFRNLLVELSQERIVIFSTHIIEDISSSCNNVAVINRGRLKYSGTPQNMVSLGEGFIWSFTMTQEEFNNYENKQMIIHHMSDGKNIKVRCISKEKPSKDAINVKPLLEDAYLCLLKDIS